VTPLEAPDADAVAALAGRLAKAIAAADATAPGVAAAVGDDVEDDGAPLGARSRPHVAGVEAVTVTRKWDSDVPNAAEIVLSAGLSLEDVEARLGGSSPVPPSAPGDDLVVLEAQDGPATIFASLDPDGDVRSITVRRDN
jgi:hypothetical protein